MRRDAQNAFKVRISIKTALGDNAYAWDASEEYLFKAMVAFAMRRYSDKETTQISNVLLCNMTERVSFWFVVTDSAKNVTTVPGSEVEAAIRMNRNRINSAFLLTDNTLQFLKISSTLSPPIEPTVPVWLIVFSVVLCLVVAGILFLVVSGIRQRKKSRCKVKRAGKNSKVRTGYADPGPQETNPTFIDCVFLFGFSHSSLNLSHGVRRDQGIEQWKQHM
ncbi:collectrin isoform X2 [Eretmochelys imbricata]